MSSFTALYDSCVLYPAPLRDLLLQLGLSGLFRAKWTAKIHEEWISNVLKNRKDLKRSQLIRTRQLMDQAIDDCLVEDFEELIPTLKLPDTDDRHVLAAAIVGRADVIVTYNLKDFPKKDLSKYKVEAQHPDEFIYHLLDLSTPKVCAAVKQVRARLKNPEKSIDDYLDTLLQQQLVKTVSVLEKNKALL